MASFGVGVLGLPWSSVDFPPGEVHLWLVVATARACGAVLGRPRGVSLSLCAQPFLGAVHGEGRGLEENREGTRPWIALGGTGLLEGPLVGRLGWSVRLGFAVPLLSQAFTVDQPTGDAPPLATTRTVTAFQPASIGGLLGAGLRFPIP
ncbi:hypothetical protein [Polyangium sp. y55x31]|uniref:hypothetical protein n=1 Tax=Polyangium sp. y55x31 TaxID=3042688 RepID=UPI0024821FE1|nr:hypothetical protein [Polyangium sp. y55x31]